MSSHSPGPDGPIQAWLASPRGAGKRRLPAILHVHGGPTGAWGPGGTLDETRAVRGRLPRADAEHPRLDDVRWPMGARPLLGVGRHRRRGRARGGRRAREARPRRPKRLGVMGLSYGGFLTQWLIGVTDRFSAASSENGVANQASAWANSYFGVHYNRRAGPRRPAQRTRAMRSCGAPRRCATRRTRTHRCSCSSPRRTGSARPPTTSSSSPR